MLSPLIATTLVGAVGALVTAFALRASWAAFRWILAHTLLGCVMLPLLAFLFTAMPIGMFGVPALLMAMEINGVVQPPIGSEGPDPTPEFLYHSPGGSAFRLGILIGLVGYVAIIIYWRTRRRNQQTTLTQLDMPSDLL